MCVIMYILIYQSSESLGPRGLRRGVCPAQVLSSVRDLAALRGDLGVDFMGVSRYQTAVQQVICGPCSFFPAVFGLKFHRTCF